MLRPECLVRHSEVPCAQIFSGARKEQEAANRDPHRHLPSSSAPSLLSGPSSWSLIFSRPWMHWLVSNLADCWLPVAAQTRSRRSAIVDSGTAIVPVSFFVLQNFRYFSCGPIP